MENKRLYFIEVKLKEQLKRKGMSQRELSQRTGLREATISELANNTRSTLNQNQMFLIMDVLNITKLDDFLKLHVYTKE